MKVIIAGSRTATFRKVAEAVYFSGWYDQITEVVCGNAPGADSHGKRYAEMHGFPVKEFPADWFRYGKAAGPIRNQQMAEYADALIAVWDEQSKGTRDMIERAKRRGLRVAVYPFKPSPRLDEVLP